jgi:predicted phosphodiesterase
VSQILTKRHLVEDIIARYPDYPARTLAKTLYNENPFLFESVEKARVQVRYYLGLLGKNSRDRKKPFHRKRRKAGQLMEIPKSKAKPIKPYFIRGQNKILVISDLHLPYHDEKAIEVALMKGKSEKVNIIILLGDLLDMYQMSQWVKDPKNPNMAFEIETCREFLQMLRKEFPDADIIWKEGNHEARWQTYFYRNAPDVAVLPGMTVYDYMNVEQYGVQVVREHRPISVSTLLLYHGHELPRGLTNPVNQARGQWLRATANMIAGHGHRTSTHIERSATGQIFSNWSIGCLCDLTPQYAPINKWNHGFGILTQEGPKSFHFNNYSIHDGKLFGSPKNND